ncbi:uncharacterized protein LOC116022791 [Ipomoea triloba]|uniref:uncharacterized protein LOC116022791 n=1 Tax=Ipomoea triloba TaxID=35885 RepID=UPI00125E5441|nr:uncharacterized protein LOC116022791 [Ipomoea triloba]
MKGGKATQNRFLRFLALPMRCLSRTRDCYINGMNNYAVVNQPKAPSRVQRSYSVSSQGSNDSEDYRELLKAASMRGMEGRIELERLMQQYMKQQQAAAAAMAMRSSQRVRRSSSVAMGRIDEESGAGEDDSNHGVDEMKYPRSKSYAVNNKRSTVIGF